MKGDDAGNIRELGRLRDEIERLAGDHVVVPVRIMGGKRWAAIRELPATRRLPAEEGFSPHMIETGDGWGLVIYGWDFLSPELREYIGRRCREEHQNQPGRK